MNPAQRSGRRRPERQDPALLASNFVARGQARVSERIPVIHEVPTVSTRVVEGDAVRVGKHRDEHAETVDPALLAEAVEVHRVALRREVDAPVPVRVEGDTTVISVHEQVAVVTTRWVVVEEIHLRRQLREHRSPQTVVLAREHVEIERTPAPSPHPTD